MSSFLVFSLLPQSVKEGFSNLMAGKSVVDKVVPTQQSPGPEEVKHVSPSSNGTGKQSAPAKSSGRGVVAESVKKPEEKASKRTRKVDSTDAKVPAPAEKGKSNRSRKTSGSSNPGSGNGSGNAGIDGATPASSGNAAAGSGRRSEPAARVLDTTRPGPWWRDPSTAMQSGLSDSVGSDALSNVSAAKKRLKDSLKRV